MSWPTVSLGELAEFINGAAFRPEDWGDEGLKIIRIQNLTDKNKPFNHTKRVVDKKLYVHKGDILVSWSATLGVYIWDKDEVGLLNQHIFKVIPNLKIVDKNYLEKSLVGALADMNKHLHGATMKHVNRGEFLATKILLPPLAEQQRIASILDRAEHVKRKRELTIEKLDLLAESIFLEMFGNPYANPKNFREESLLEFFKFKTGKLDSNAASIDGIYPFFTCAKEDFFIDKYAFDEEALLLAGNNANADYSVKHFKGKFNAYQRTYVINLADLRNSYIYAKDCLEFKLKELKHVSKGSSTKYLTMGIFKKMKLLVPPVELQQEYSSRILNLRLSKEIMLSDLSTCNALNASLRAKFLI